jgi:hypothetical protein
MIQSLPASLRHGFIVMLVGWALLTPLTTAAELVTQTQSNVMVEMPFIAGRPHNDPFNDVTLDVIFKDPAGQDLRVPAFWAGKNVWKVRYASPTVGVHAFRTECSDAADPGLHGVTGKVEIKPYDGKNPL